MTRDHGQYKHVGKYTIAFSAIGLFLVIGVPHLLPSQALAMHTHFNVTINNGSVTVPAGIGIDSPLWNNHTLDQYGSAGHGPIHTHDATGLIHIESTKQREFTFGDFLNIWGFPITGPVKFSVNGIDVKNYRAYVLQDQDQIKLVVR